MDPENLRTIVTGLVTATVGLVPAVLLYLQNAASSEREARERREERESVDQRTVREEIERAAAANALALEADRQRYLRLLVIVEKITTELSARSSSTIGVYNLAEADRAELALAVSDVGLSDDPQLRVAAEVLRRRLMGAVVSAAEHGGYLQAEDDKGIDAALGAFREQARAALDARSRNSTAQSATLASGQEPSTP